MAGKPAPRVLIRIVGQSSDQKDDRPLQIFLEIRSDTTGYSFQSARFFALGYLWDAADLTPHSLATRTPKKIMRL